MTGSPWDAFSGSGSSSSYVPNGPARSVGVLLVAGVVLWRGRKRTV
ncbi:hypothetical protein ACFC96_35565 [Streptomyces sp. NPDC055955]